MGRSVTIVLLAWLWVSASTLMAQKVPDAASLAFAERVSLVEGERGRWILSEDVPVLFILIEQDGRWSIQIHTYGLGIETEYVEVVKQGLRSVYQNRSGKRYIVRANGSMKTVLDGRKVVLAQLHFGSGDVPMVGDPGVEAPVFTYKYPPRIPAGKLNRPNVPVVLQATFRTDGRIEDIREVSYRGNPAFTRAAIEALQRWQFMPGKVDGEPADVRMNIEMDFVAY